MNQLRSLLYALARLLGDANAIQKSVERGSVEPIAKRAGRKLAGRLLGSIINSIFR